jgi:hypothetical protein
MNTVDPFGNDWGRLGNQLFQLALLFGVRQARGHDFYVRRRDEPVWDAFELDVPESGPRCPRRFVETLGSCNFDARVFDQPSGTSFRGYFQSYRYFDGWRDELLRFLRPRTNWRAYSEALLFAWRRQFARPVATVHVRRQDYVRNGCEDHWGDLVQDGFYRRAVEKIGADVTYVVLSDDLDWCRRSLGIEGALFVDVDHFTALGLMAGCDVNVVANSSFSWWGAYLNRGSDVYAPGRWFGPRMPPPNDRQCDIVPPAWHTIATFAEASGSGG